MGFDRRFTLALVARVVALAATLVGLIAAFRHPDMAAVRLVTIVLVTAAVVALVRHVERTNVTVARFVEALRFGDVTTRFDGRGGAGFDALGRALDGAMRDLQAQRDRGAQELRFLEALVDDAPVALLTVEGGRVRLANKAARRLFDRIDATAPEEFARFGATFAARLVQPGPVAQELVILQLTGGLQRAIMRSATLERLGTPVRAITVEPIQSTLDEIEMAAQTDLVRVLTHEILNSLTPVTSLAGTAGTLLGADPPDLPAARTAIDTLARRAESLRRFIDSYRAVARPPEPRRRLFESQPFAAELARLFAAEWPEHALTVETGQATLIDADPDLLAQALINLLRNAAQASGAAGRVRLAIDSGPDGLLIEVEDDGPGIAAEIQGDIFLPFFTTRAAGTGVGLNLVRQIVVAHGWRIEVGAGAMGGALFRMRGSGQSPA